MPAICGELLELPYTLNSRNKLATVANLLKSDLLGLCACRGDEGGAPFGCGVG
jgi:hypothetical protein